MEISHIATVKHREMGKQMKETLLMEQLVKLLDNQKVQLHQVKKQTLLLQLLTDEQKNKNQL